MIRKITIAVLAFLIGAPAGAQDGDLYIDQRSTATELLTSYYNAINRNEYARAWAYWDGHNEHQSYDDFVNGFSRTRSVALIAGPESSEGAAGSIYFSLPVAIEVTDVDGDIQVYSGCYTLRLAEPAIQDPPFRALHIEAETLNQRVGTLADVGPESCD